MSPATGILILGLVLCSVGSCVARWGAVTPSDQTLDRACRLTGGMCLDSCYSPLFQRGSCNNGPCCSPILG
ncbi:hypothetical protein FKM82_025273 [Ascaphus truei]